MLPPFSKANSNRQRIICAATFLLAICSSVPALAGEILDFSIGHYGTVIYAPNEKHHPGIWGSRIVVGDLMYSSNTVKLLGGRLNFSVGPLTNFNGTSSLWGAGGKLSVIGCADLNRDGKCDKGDIRGALMTASFIDAKMVERNGQEFLEGQIVEQLNPQLAALLHLPSKAYTGELNLMLAQLSHSCWRVRDGVYGGWLTDFGTVPETSSIWLLSAGLLYFAISRIRGVQSN